MLLARREGRPDSLAHAVRLEPLTGLWPSLLRVREVPVIEHDLCQGGWLDRRQKRLVDRRMLRHAPDGTRRSE